MLAARPVFLTKISMNVTGVEPAFLNTCGGLYLSECDGFSHFFSLGSEEDLHRTRDGNKHVERTFVVHMRGPHGDCFELDARDPNLRGVHDCLRTHAGIPAPLPALLTKNRCAAEREDHEG